MLPGGEHQTVAVRLEPVIPIEVTEDVVLKYVFSASDHDLAFAKSNARLRRWSFLMGAAYILAAGFLVYFDFVMLASGTPDIWALGASVLFVAASIRLAMNEIEKFVWGGEPNGQFEPFEIETSFSRTGVSNKTPYVQNAAVWRAVNSLVIRDYGIAIETLSSRWFVPASAFANRLEMEHDFKRIKTIQRQADRNNSGGAAAGQSFV